MKILLQAATVSALLIDDVEVQVYSISNLTSSYVWEDFTFTHLATSDNTKIEFRNEQNANLHFAFIDGVGASTVPEPSSFLMLGLGAVSLLARRKRI